MEKQQLRKLIREEIEKEFLEEGLGKTIATSALAGALAFGGMSSAKAHNNVNNSEPTEISSKETNKAPKLNVTYKGGDKQYVKGNKIGFYNIDKGDSVIDVNRYQKGAPMGKVADSLMYKMDSPNSISFYSKNVVGIGQTIVGFEITDKSKRADIGFFEYELKPKINGDSGRGLSLNDIKVTINDLEPGNYFLTIGNTNITFSVSK